MSAQDQGIVNKERLARNVYEVLVAHWQQTGKSIELSSSEQENWRKIQTLMTVPPPAPWVYIYSQLADALLRRIESNVPIQAVMLHAYEEGVGVRAQIEQDILNNALQLRVELMYMPMWIGTVTMPVIDRYHAGRDAEGRSLTLTAPWVDLARPPVRIVGVVIAEREKAILVEIREIPGREIETSFTRWLPRSHIIAQNGEEFLISQWLSEKIQIEVGDNRVALAVQSIWERQIRMAVMQNNRDTLQRLRERASRERCSPEIMRMLDAAQQEIDTQHQWARAIREARASRNVQEALNRLRVQAEHDAVSRVILQQISQAQAEAGRIAIQQAQQAEIARQRPSRRNPDPREPFQSQERREPDSTIKTTARRFRWDTDK